MAKISYFYDKLIIFENNFGQKIEKNNNPENIFLGIDTHYIVIFRKKNFCKLHRRRHFSELSKKVLTTRPKKAGLRFLIYSNKLKKNQKLITRPACFKRCAVVNFYAKSLPAVFGWLSP